MTEISQLNRIEEELEELQYTANTPTEKVEEALDVMQTARGYIDIVCKKYNLELIEVLESHYQKLEDRQKEWAEKELRKECRYIEGYCSYCGGCNAES
jgi:hypothetical protein